MPEPSNTGSSTGNCDHATPSSTRYTRDNNINGFSNKDFEGTTPQLGGVLCTKSENHIKDRVGYEKFKDLLSNYIVNTMKDPVEIVQALSKNTDPMVEYDKKYPPKMVVKPEAGSIEEMILRD